MGKDASTIYYDCLHESVDYITDKYSANELKKGLRYASSECLVSNTPDNYSDRINGTNGAEYPGKEGMARILQHDDWEVVVGVEEEQEEEPDESTVDPDPDVDADVTADDVSVEIDTSEMSGLEEQMAETFQSAISVSSNDLEEAFEQGLEGVKTEIEEKLDDLKKLEAREVEIKLPDGTKEEVEGEHEKFEDVLQVAMLREPILLVGPAGTGKSRMAKKVAETMDLPFDSKSIGPRTGEHAFFGSATAEGEYRKTSFYERYVNGGVYLLDEWDCANTQTLKSANSAVSNGIANFPVVGQKEAHEDFIFIGTANTFGRGADMEYVGANQIDASVRDRPVVMTIDYDEELEKRISPDLEWTEYVQDCREVIRDHGIRHVVSMRASIKGGKLLEAGFEWDRVENMVLWKGLEQDQISKVKDNVA